MIIKIITGTETHVRDGVSDLTYTRGERSLFSGKPADVWYEDVQPGLSEGNEYIALSYRKSDGGYASVVTCFPVYLLNDNGKTIERLS